MLESGRGGAESAAAMFGPHAGGEEKHRRWVEARNAEVRMERNRWEEAEWG